MYSRVETLFKKQNVPLAYICLTGKALFSIYAKYKDLFLKSISCCRLVGDIQMLSCK